jgi:Tfp pilus assembly protein PilE
MRNTKRDFTLKERMMVVAILLVLAVVAAQNLMQSVTDSEERAVNAASINYAGVRNMYAEKSGGAPATVIQASAMQTEIYPDTPTK